MPITKEGQRRLRIGLAVGIGAVTVGTVGLHLVPGILPDRPSTPIGLPTGTPEPSPTPTEVPSPTPTPTLTPTPNAYEKIADTMPEFPQIGVSRPEQVKIMASQLEQITTVLEDAGLIRGNTILTADQSAFATDPNATEGVVTNPERKTITANYSEAATAYVSFGGGKITDDQGNVLTLPNGVVDFSANPEMVSPENADYPYASQAYLVVYATRPGPDVTAPEIPDQDQNSKIVVKPNAEIQYAYVARGNYQDGTDQQPRTISDPWLAEQIYLATGGLSNCGTGCGEATVIIIGEGTSAVGKTEQTIVVYHVSRVVNEKGEMEFRAIKGAAELYNPDGIRAVEEYLGSKVLPTWPERTATPTPKP